MEKQGFIYILASKKNGTIYIGATSNLAQRIYQHKNNMVEGFTKKYQVHTLVYYEIYNQFTDALIREKTLKGITRKRKMELIENVNTEWRDISNEI